MTRSLEHLFLITTLTIGAGACDLGGILGDQLCDESQNHGTMTATVDGASYTSCMTSGSFGGGTLSITGQAFEGTDSKQLQVNVMEATVGTFTLGGASASNIGRYSLTLETYVTAVDPAVGEVEITALDDSHATGTFSFKATSATGGGAVEVTDGAFDVDFE